MTRKKLEFDRDLCPMRVSTLAREFLRQHKFGPTEPYYRVLDRIINKFGNSKIFELEEKIRGLEAANAYQRKLIQQMDKERQMTLTTFQH